MEERTGLTMVLLSAAICPEMRRKRRARRERKEASEGR